MNYSLLFILLLLSMTCSSDKDAEDKKIADQKELISHESVHFNPNAILSDYYKIPEKYLNLNDCLRSETKEKREKLIQKQSEALIRFHEACNGGTCEFAFLAESQWYFLSVCLGGPGCNQKVYFFDSLMIEIGNTFPSDEIQRFLQQNPEVIASLERLRLSALSAKSLIYSFNNQTGNLELIADPEFTDERTTVALVTVKEKSLVLTPVSF